MLLRHRPEAAGLVLDRAGWVRVDDLLRGMWNKRGTKVTKELLQQVVDTNNKRRFEFNEDGTKIRARQGHSVGVDLGYEPEAPPEILYHGTGSQNVASIRKKGLQKRQRHAVHLSLDKATAANVGSRHGKPVLLTIKARQMHDNGHVFYLTENKVWYTDNVPVDYIIFPEEITKS